MLNIINIFSPLKKIPSICLMKIYFLTLCVFLIAKTDSYACDAFYKGHIKFSNESNAPINVIVSYIKNKKSYTGKCLRINSKTKECDKRMPVLKKVVVDKKIFIQTQTTSGGQCWRKMLEHEGDLIYFKTSFKYNGKIVQGPAGKIKVGTDYSESHAYGQVSKYEGNQEHITSSGCNSKSTVCTVKFKLKKKK